MLSRSLSYAKVVKIVYAYLKERSNIPLCMFAPLVNYIQLNDFYSYYECKYNRHTSHKVSTCYTLLSDCYKKGVRLLSIGHLSLFFLFYCSCFSRHSRGVMPSRVENILYN